MADYDRDLMHEVEVRWSDEGDDGTGRLMVRAAAGGFAGASSAWFDRIGLLDFADRLDDYPILAGSEISVSGGFGGDDPQEHVGLVVVPVGPRGQVAAQVHLARPIWPDTPVGERHEAHVEVLTTYQRLSGFSRDLRAVIEGDATVAVLGGEVLA